MRSSENYNIFYDPKPFKFTRSSKKTNTILLMMVWVLISPIIAPLPLPGAILCPLGIVVPSPGGYSLPLLSITYENHYMTSALPLYNTLHVKIV